jgi:hypothetical protein
VIVAYDLAGAASTSLTGGLVAHHPGQVLWAYQTRSQLDARLCADVTTLIYHRIPRGHAPLGSVEPETLAGRIQSASASYPELAPSAGRDGAILAKMPRDGSSTGAPGIRRTSGERERRWRDSPVPQR